MKKIIQLLAICVLFINIATAQFFQGTFERDVTDVLNLKINFKMKPTANLNTQISYMEVAFRFPSATTPAFTISNISSNTATFPGMAFQRFTPDFAADGFTYYKFVMNTAIVPSAAYNASAEYTLFSITTSLPATAMPQFEMVSNLLRAQYQFGAVNGAGNFITPGNDAQLYGPGYYTDGDNHIVPLFAGPLPVQFRSFNVTRKDTDAILEWTVENQDANTSHFEIERSVNGTAFSKIKQTEANITTSSFTYTTADINVVALRAPLVYYRIKQVDKDGRFAYTEVRNVKFTGKTSAYVYPNPVRDKAMLSFYLPEAQTVSIRVIDATGKTLQLLQLKGLKGYNQQSIDAATLASGTYKIIVQAGDVVETLHFVKGK